MSKYRTLIVIDGITDIDGTVYFECDMMAVWPHRKVLLRAELFPQTVLDHLDCSPGVGDGAVANIYCRANLEAANSKELEMEGPWELNFGKWEASNEPDALFGMVWISHHRVEINE